MRSQLDLKDLRFKRFAIACQHLRSVNHKLTQVIFREFAIGDRSLNYREI
ncbi:hypothetical protein HC766_07945 [Candidatus Gracilibacteria bacterium]|nr:hypothetical protein [Candidatus Gracilibacteria bacterium]